MRMLRNRLAGVLAFVAVLAAGWASSALWVTRTIGDEARVESVAERFVASSEGRSMLASALRDGATPVLGEQGAQIAEAAAADDRVATAATDALLVAYRTLCDGTGPVVLDSAPVVAAFGDQARVLFPGDAGEQAAATFAQNPPQVTLPQLPGAMSWTLSEGPGLVVRVGGLIAAAAAAGAFVIAADRDRILRRFGRFLVVTGVTTGVIAVALPGFLTGRGGVAAFVGELLGAATAAMVGVAVAEVTAGAALWTAGVVVKRHAAAGPPARDEKPADSRRDAWPATPPRRRGEPRGAEVVADAALTYQPPVSARRVQPPRPAYGTAGSTFPAGAGSYDGPSVFEDSVFEDPAAAQPGYRGGDVGFGPRSVEESAYERSVFATRMSTAGEPRDGGRGEKRIRPPFQPPKRPDGRY